MKTPDLYLKELLFDYDCVTIPGFGGFIMQTQPARIERQKQRIHPPSRVPSFNSLLIHDDGLLISKISNAEKISYHQAGERVRQFAENLKKRIVSGEKIRLNIIGEFSRNQGDGILFNPSHEANFLASAYGMDPIKLYPVLNTTNTARGRQKHADRTARQFRSRQPASVRWTVALSIPVIIFLLYGIIFPVSFQQSYTNYSGIVSDIFKGKKVEMTTTKDALPSLPVTINEPAEVPQTLSEKVTASVPDNAVDKVPDRINPLTKKYYIIGGCFEREENAKNFLSILISKGYEAEVAGMTGRGHMRISYKSFTDKEPALSYLQKIREKENPSAWLLKF